MAEAIPGVLTPLGWSVWGPAGELGARAAFYAIGAIRRDERGLEARSEDRFFNIFYGRPVARVDFLAMIGDRMPCTSAEAIASQVLGFVPPGFVGHPTRRRYPMVAARFPKTFVTTPRTLRRVRVETERWWRAELARTAQLDLAGARAQLEAGIARFRRNVSIQGTALIACIQPVYDQLSRLAGAAGVDSAALMSGLGSHEETAVVGDVWAVSRGRLDLAVFLDRHGYHGPGEGQISAVVWREDPAPVRTLVDGYRALADDADPLRAQARVAERRQAEDRLLAAVAPHRRVLARLVLRLARTYLPLRGVGKVAFLQSLDVARAAARRIGALLAGDGVLDDPEDVFFLTADELTGPLPGDPAGLVAERRARHRHYETLRVPDAFQGDPEPEEAATEGAAVPSESLTVTGVGASSGVVEGRVVVVTDPATAAVEPGDILVAHTTDPSWASVMFLSKALVVDIGNLLSHAAVIGRELGIPCVMGTGTGTRVLRTGDFCRVDGSAGTVVVLERAAG